VGQRFGGFLDLREKVFFLSTIPGAVLPVEFLKKITNQNILEKDIVILEVGSSIILLFPF